MTTPTDDEDATMKGSMQDNATRAVSDEAAEWFIRLRDDRLGARNRERNVRWLKQSPTHIAELLRIQQIYKALRAANLQNRSPGATGGEAPSNVIELIPRHRPAPLPPLDEPTESRVRFPSWKVAAAVACLTISLLLGFIVKVAWLDRTIETELGEWRTATLTDGTRLRVGPGSKLRFAFGDDHRTIKLIRGEALFDVAKDPSRPFFVQSEMVGVLAVGTEFRVSRRGGEDIVAVTEGTVAVYRDGRSPMRGPLPETPAKVADATGAVALTAGEQVSITPTTQTVPVVAKQKVNADYESAWADGWLTYENRTIAEVANEFNRRNRLKIIVADPVIGARRLAFFRGIATDPESFAAALEVNRDIAVVRDEPGVLRVEHREPAEMPNGDLPPSVSKEAI